MKTLPFVAAEGVARAPLVFVLGGLCGSLALAGRGVDPAIAALTAPLFTLSLILLFSERYPPAFFLCAALLVSLTLLASLRCHGALMPRTVPDGSFHDGGEVVYERPWGGQRTVIVDGARGRFLMKVPVDKGVREGDGVLLSGRAIPIRTRRDSSFREDRYWRARGAVFEVVPEEMTVRRERVWSLPARRTALRERMLRVLPERTRGYLLAALLGVRDPDLAERHRRWGTAHLLAVSGFHVGLVSLWTWRALRSRLIAPRVGRPMAVLLVSLFVWGYALLAGGAPSALRAVFMIQCVLLGQLAGRRGNPVNSVAFAAICLLLWNPVWFWDVGWRLSVISALLLSALYGRVEGWKTLAAASPLVWLATFPQASAVFGAVPAAGMAVNLAALPVFGYLYPAGLLLSLPALLGLPGGSVAARAAEGLFSLWEGAAEGVVRIIPWTVSWTPLLAAAGAGLFLFVVAWGAYPMRLRTVAATGLSLIAGVALL